MLLQTNSYMVPRDKRAEHARMMRRFRQTLTRLGCDQFDAYEELGPNWNANGSGRYVQIMRFRDRRHHQAVQAAERTDPSAQQLIQEFCELVDFSSQQEAGQYSVRFYGGVVPESSVPTAGFAMESEQPMAVAAQDAEASEEEQLPLMPPETIEPPPLEATDMEEAPKLLDPIRPIGELHITSDEPQDHGDNNKPQQ